MTSFSLRIVLRASVFPSDFTDDAEFLTLGKLKITGEKFTEDKSESKPP